MRAAQPKVSVVMASYNHEAFVREAIESVLSQSYQNFELVITDDGSADDTVKAIQSVSDARIRLNIFKENQGACVAVNDAIARAVGVYIAVLNSDDFFLPGKLEKQVRFLDAHPEVGAVFGLPDFVDQHGEPFTLHDHVFSDLFSTENRSRQEWLRHFLHHGNCLCHPTLLIRKSCYEKVGLYDPLLMQLPDLDMWVRLCGTYEIQVIPEKLTAFRILDAERNTSAPSPQGVARLAWETPRVLGHYESLSDDDLRAVLNLQPGARGMHAQQIDLALEAIKVGRLGYAVFGLDLLRRSMQKNSNVFSYPEYFRMVGRIDPLATAFSKREYRLILGTGVFDAVRKLIRWIRSLMSHKIKNFGRML